MKVLACDAERRGKYSPEHSSGISDVLLVNCAGRVRKSCVKGDKN